MLLYGLNRYGAWRRIVNVLASLSVVMGTAWSAWANDAMTILALGDSLTAGYGLAQSDSFPSQLETALRAQGHDITVVNGGVSGDTSAGGRSRLDWLVDASVDLVVIELGANDGLRGIEPSQTRQNIEWILDRLKEKKVPALLTGMLAPPNLGADYGAEFKAIYPDLATKYEVPLDPFFLQDVAANPDLNQADGIHPNKRGVDIIVQRLVPMVLDTLKKEKPAPGGRSGL